MWFRHYGAVHQKRELHWKKSEGSLRRVNRQYHVEYAQQWCDEAMDENFIGGVDLPIYSNISGLKVPWALNKTMWKELKFQLT